MEAESPYKGQTGLRRILSATRNSLEGFAAAVRHEDAFRQELIMAALFVPAGLWLGRNGLERAILVAAVLFVLVVELLNSAVGGTGHRLSLDNNRPDTRAKDIGSAAVMLSITTAAAVWLLVLLR